MRGQSTVAPGQAHRLGAELGLYPAQHGVVDAAFVTESDDGGAIAGEQGEARHGDDAMVLLDMAAQEESPAPASPRPCPVDQARQDRPDRAYGWMNTFSASRPAIAR
ncbi:hypothetical protein [Streptomyces sp. NPDC059909]|uniref:hypothetical protein n=1 Tax=Streptomyces sp. NPDC059909 TaxID=3346998 RepID=UPI003658EDD3